MPLLSDKKQISPGTVRQEGGSRARLYRNILFYAAVFYFTIPSVTAVYAVQLNQPFVIQPMIFSPRSTPLVTPGAVAKDAPAISQVFISQILKSASENRSLLVWSMYPSSARGRVFGGTGGDPTISNAVGGW